MINFITSFKILLDTAGKTKINVLNVTTKMILPTN